MGKRIYDEFLIVVKQGEQLPKVGGTYSCVGYFSDEKRYFTVHRIKELEWNENGELIVTLEIK